MKAKSGPFAALLVLAFARPASGAPVVTAPAAGEVLRAGQLVEVSWRGVPAGTEELEILLSLDDGETFPVRLTEKLDGDEKSILWRVPNLAAGRARLLIRYESDGAETPGEKGPAFRIEGDPALRLDSPRRRAGELWLDASFPGAPDVGTLEDSREPALHGASRDEDLLFTSRERVSPPGPSREFAGNAIPAKPQRTTPGSPLLDLAGGIPQRK
ncbi:MAG TPA: hypothetical protein VMN04_14460 [Thermoanaerobaculia bacterium]|nr:hypothetical protein [Thermoanaerobaculia bacterium]